MSVTPAETVTPGAPTEPPAAAATPTAPTPTEPPKAVEPSNPWADPKAAEAEIARLRQENAKDRTNAKAQAAEEARKELAQTIGKALGFVEDEQMDPARLTESLTTAQAEAKRARVELAVFRAAGAVNGDPSALLDSTSFLASLNSVDPADTAAVQAAIATAVADNPRLGAATGPRTPAPNPAQGAGAGGPAGGPPQLTKADLDRMFREGKHDEITEAKKA